MFWGCAGGRLISLLFVDLQETLIISHLALLQSPSVLVHEILSCPIEGLLLQMKLNFVCMGMLVEAEYVGLRRR